MPMKWDDSGWKKFEKQLTAPIKLSDTGSESADVAALKKEMKNRGVPISDSAARKAVRDARKSR